jgi:uncharacterized membrane protein YedE/YeeE
MTYWPWWGGGLALAGVMLLHWLLTGRMMAVSGRYTALVNRLRHGAAEDPEGAIDAQAMVMAIRAATLEQFGAGALRAAPGADAAPSLPPTEPALLASPQSTGDHLLFLICLAVGGLASALLSGRFHVTALLDGPSFARLTRGSTGIAFAVLLAGGALVGFGTRMASGCTSGHGMCGVSRFQKGSLLATVAFFGTGVLTSLALGYLR